MDAEEEVVVVDAEVVIVQSATRLDDHLTLASAV